MPSIMEQAEVVGTTCCDRSKPCCQRTGVQNHRAGRFAVLLMPIPSSQTRRQQCDAVSVPIAPRKE